MYTYVYYGSFFHTHHTTCTTLTIVQFAIHTDLQLVRLLEGGLRAPTRNQIIIRVFIREKFDENGFLC